MPTRATTGYLPFVLLLLWWSDGRCCCFFCCGFQFHGSSGSTSSRALSSAYYSHWSTSWLDSKLNSDLLDGADEDEDDYPSNDDRDGLDEVLDVFDKDTDEEDDDDDHDHDDNVVNNVTQDNAHQSKTRTAISLWDEIGGIRHDLEDEEDFTRFSKMKWKKKTYLMMQDVRKEMGKNRKRAPKKAEEVVLRLQRWYDFERERREGNDEDFEVDDLMEVELNEEEVEDTLLGNMESTLVQAYNLWIHALAKSGLQGAGYMGEDVLMDMISRGIPANSVTYSSILDAHARLSSKHGGGAQAAEDFLFRILQTGASEGNFNEVACDTILNAWAQEGTMESAERAEMILCRLEDNKQANIRPTPMSYATVINAFAKVGSTEAAERAEALLCRMIQRASLEAEDVQSKPRSRNSKQQTRVVRPDTITFNACINAWATSRDPRAGKKSLEIFEQMKKFSATDEFGYDAQPDTVTYNTILSCWSHCGDRNAALQAEKIVKEMRTIRQQSIDSTAVNPNTVTFNNVLHAWSQSKLPNAACRAEELIEYMMQSNDPTIAPDVYSFNCVMDALSKSKEPHKARRTREWLDRSQDMYDETQNPNLKPTQIEYNTVLNACAFSARRTSQEEQREALKIAVSTFASMPGQGVRRDTVTYGTMLKCFANLIPKGDVRNRMALQVFQECCDEGMVGNLVWNEIRRAIPLKLLQEACQLKRACGSLEVQDLPPAWCVNNKRDKPKPLTMQQEAGSKKTRSSSSPNPKAKGEKEVTKEKPKVFIVERSFSSDKDMIF